MDKEIAIFIGSSLAVVALIVGGIMLAANIMGSYRCESYSRITGKNTKWNTLDECYVQTADGWQRWDEYTKRAIASEGLSK